MEGEYVSVATMIEWGFSERFACKLDFHFKTVPSVSQTKAANRCYQEALPREPASPHEDCCIICFARSEWQNRIVLNRRDTYEKINLYYVERSVKGTMKPDPQTHAINPNSRETAESFWDPKVSLF